MNSHNMNPLEQLLISGSDTRLTVNPVTGLNRFRLCAVAPARRPQLWLLHRRHDLARSVSALSKPNMKNCDLPLVRNAIWTHSLKYCGTA